MSHFRFSKPSVRTLPLLLSGSKPEQKSISNLLGQMVRLNFLPRAKLDFLKFVVGNFPRDFLDQFSIWNIFETVATFKTPNLMQVELLSRQTQHLVKGKQSGEERKFVENWPLLYKRRESALKFYTP